MSKIYVCDDDPVILMMTKRILGRVHQITTCQTLDGLIKEIENDKPDLILLDFLMPEGDGLNAIRILREKGFFPAIPIVIVTGDRDTTLEIKCYNEGVEELIRKPFVPDVLLLKVEQVLKNVE